MKLAAWLIVPSLLLLLGLGVLLRFRDVQATFATSGLTLGLCQADDQIADETREQINSTAVSFVELFGRSPLEARQRMSERGRAATSARAPLENAQAIYRSIELIGPPVVTETYLLRFLSGSETGLRVPCGFHDGRAVFISRGGTPASAAVVITEDLAAASQRTTTVWIERENGEWRVRALNFGLSRIAGKDSEQLWESLRQQRARGHLFNAAILYAAARSTLQRGSFYQSRMAQDFNADASTFVAPDMVRGEAPFTWSFGNETFHVIQVQYTGFENADVGLIIDHAPPAWTQNEEAEAINRRLIDGFTTAYPEWRETFDAIVARAAKPGGNERWGTVHTSEHGYSDSSDTDSQKSD